MTRFAWGRRAILVLLVLGTLTNLGVLLRTPPTAFPLRAHNDGSLVTLVDTEQRSLRLAYGFYVDLVNLGSNATLVNTVRVIEPSYVDGLADVEVVPGPEARLSADVDPAALEGVTGTLEYDEQLIDYLIVPGGPTGDIYTALIFEGDLLVVPESLSEEVTG
jgi:hypothetical protein